MTIPRRQFLHIAAAGLALPALPQGCGFAAWRAWTWATGSKLFADSQQANPSAPISAAVVGR
jgi:hypothetical protein